MCTYYNLLVLIYFKLPITSINISTEFVPVSIRDSGFTKKSPLKWKSPLNKSTKVGYLLYIEVTHAFVLDLMLTRI